MCPLGFAAWRSQEFENLKNKNEHGTSNLKQ
jgi:hypothetical protein